MVLRSRNGVAQPRLGPAEGRDRRIGIRIRVRVGIAALGWIGGWGTEPEGGRGLRLAAGLAASANHGVDPDERPVAAGALVRDDTQPCGGEGLVEARLTADR